MTDPKLLLKVEGDDSRVAHPLLRMQQQGDQVAFFFVTMGLSSDFEVRPIDALQSCEAPHEFCSVTQSIVNGVAHPIPILPRASTRALMTPKVSGDLAGLRLAKAYSTLLLSPTSPRMVTIARRLVGSEPHLRLTERHVEILDRVDITAEALRNTRGKVKSESIQWALLPIEARMLKTTEQKLKLALEEMEQTGQCKLFDEISIAAHGFEPGEQTTS